MQESTQEDPLRQAYLNHWNETWSGFKRAIVSTEDFNALGWTVKLFKAGMGAFYFKSRLDIFKIHIYWRSWVPALAIVLIVGVVASYFGSLREVVRERWCCVAGEKCSRGVQCRWLLFHDAVVVYLGFMILFNYVSACFRSPGVVLANRNQSKDENEKDSTSTGSSKKIHTRKSIQRWSAKDSRGGFCGMDAVLDVAREAWLVQTYYNLASESRKSSNTQSRTKTEQVENFPSNRETFCNKCQIKRPPRCHHCSICNRW